MRPCNMCKQEKGLLLLLESFDCNTGECHQYWICPICNDLVEDTILEDWDFLGQFDLEQE